MHVQFGDGPIEGTRIVSGRNFNMMFLLHRFLGPNSLLRQDRRRHTVNEGLQPLTVAVLSDHYLRRVLIEMQICEGDYPEYLTHPYAGSACEC